MANEFASLQGLPTSLTQGKAYSKMKPVSTGVNLPASQTDREYKSIYTNEKMVIDTDGFTIFASISPNVMFDEGMNGGQTPPTYFKFTVGKSPTYAFFFGDDAPSYSLLADTVTVYSIAINLKRKEYIITFSPTSTTPNLIIKNGKLTWKYADENGTNGFMYQESMSNYPSVLYSVAPYNQSTVSKLRTQMNEDSSLLGNMITEMNAVGEGVYIWSAEKLEVHVTPQSFTFDTKLEKEFLLPAKVDYAKITDLDTKKSFIQFQCVMSSMRTDTYTGYDKADPSIYMATLQFPGDEAKLAPMGTSKDGTDAMCGIDSAEGRVLKSITPVIINDSLTSVKLDFQDGSFYEFPDPETGEFTATDKDTGGLLQGTVKNLIVANGKWLDSYTSECANRIARNINDNLTIQEGEEVLTSAIAWRTSQWVKIIVPTKGGSKLITIPKRGA
jgi:hypothetical protein